MDDAHVYMKIPSISLLYRRPDEQKYRNNSVRLLSFLVFRFPSLRCIQLIDGAFEPVAAEVLEIAGQI